MENICIVYPLYGMQRTRAPLKTIYNNIQQPSLVRVVATIEMFARAYYSNCKLFASPWQSALDVILMGLRASHYFVNSYAVLN